MNVLPLHPGGQVRPTATGPDRLSEPLDYQGVRRILARWAPFQGLIYLHLLLWGLQPGHGRSTSRVRRPGSRMLRQGARPSGVWP